MVMYAMTDTQYQAVYNVLSFSLASMMATTVYLWFRAFAVQDKFRSAVLISGLVTFIAAYHYIRIFNSWVDAYTYSAGKVEYGMLEILDPQLTGVPFNDAYRYMDWLLTVPLLLIEILLVMNLDEATYSQKARTLGVGSALMIVSGYYGELTVSGDLTVRWVCWFLSMAFFLYIVFELLVGLAAATNSEANPTIKGKIQVAQVMTVISWCTYPIVYLFPMFGISAAKAVVAIQIGYCVSDIISKCGVGLVIYQITYAKSGSSEWMRLEAALGSSGATGGGSEAARKLISNHSNVLNDIINPNPRSQNELRRLSARDAAAIDAFLLEVAGRLMGSGGCGPSSPHQAIVWVNAADYLDKRLQAVGSQCPGRVPDMSPDAAKAMRSAMQQATASANV